MYKGRLRVVLGVAVCLALVVVMVGAYTRLTHAGLGCPDWPGCYGHMVLPADQQQLGKAQLQFPAQPIEAGKAWTEMAHRYIAGTLALLVLFIAYQFIRYQRKQALLPVCLGLLIIFQALLGMWTVTLKLLPIVVMSHLIVGITIFACLVRLNVQENQFKPLANRKFYRTILIGMVILLMQMALGGWVSANYAGIACIGFPQCNGQWLPTLHFAEGFNLFSPVGANYQGGLLDSATRVTIQYVHRLGAVITAIYLILLAVALIKKTNTAKISENRTNHLVRQLGYLLLLLVATQFLLGVANVMYLLPLPIAVAHNGVAALLMATLFSLLYLYGGKTKNAS